MKNNKETVYTPYTYLIGWSKLNKWYYGSRYATKTKCLYESGCHPDDFWVTYHTSSNKVTAFRKEHGEPDIIKIDKTFSNELEARTWEEQELVRLNVVKEDKWLNGTVSFPPPPMYGEDNPMYGKPVSEETKKKLSEAMIGKYVGEKHPNCGKTPSQEAKKKMSEGKMGEKNPNYGRTGEKHPMYGRTGEKNPMYGRTGEKNPNSKKIKVIHLGIEKTYPSVGLAAKGFNINYQTLNKLANGRIRTSTKYPDLRAEYI